MIKLYGTLTSPYVRRVRVVALELGLALELVDTFTEEGQAALRSVHPLWKIPTVELEGQALFDSEVIVDHLLRTHGADGPLARVDPSDLGARNVLTVIDGVLDALINAFYLARDGIEPGTSSYMAKQRDRAVPSMAWLAARVEDGVINGRREFGLPELALCTMLEWMQFRDTYPVDRHPGLVECLARHQERSSLVQTRPST